MPTGAYADQRSGSTLIIMVALIGALAFLGFFFYTFASNEGITAEYYSDGAKIRDGGLDPDALFDFGLRQIIVGADNNENNSVLWGGRWSLMATLVGSDNQPFTGEGRNVILDGALLPDLDQDHAGVPREDGTPGQVNINDAPGANGFFPALDTVPAPDVDYTYPDINNPFLAYKANALNAGGGAFQLIIPSFHRPQYLRNVVANDNWYSDASTTTRVSRPHKEHLAVATDGVISGQHRFVSVTYPDTTANPIDPFLFPDEIPATDWAEGIWTGDGITYIFDVDADGDGIKEAVYIDLDYPAQKRADGTVFVPLFAFTIYDGDGLINLTTSGNLAGNIDFSSLGTQPFGNGESISKSNQGMSTSEINTQWGFTADPNTEVVGSPASVFNQHNIMWGHFPADRIEAANMEWWYLTAGKPNFVFDAAAGKYNVQNITVGKWGELPRLLSTINAVDPWTPTSVNPYEFPFPGLHSFDDNGNANEGGLQTIPALWPSTTAFYPFEHPLDFVAAGRTTLGGTFGKTTLLNNFGRLQWRGYQNYYSNPTTGYRNVLGGALMPGATDYYQIDEPAEMVFDPSKAQPTDEIFSTSELYSLHGSSNDTTLTGLSSRLRDLAPLNFNSSTRAEQIRQQFTTDSWDLKSFAKPWYGPNPYAVGISDSRRHWEFSADTDADGFLEFPPDFGGDLPIPGTTYGLAGAPRDPFRAAVRNTLTVEMGNPPYPPMNSLRKIQRKLSMNGLTELYYPDPSAIPSQPRIRVRPLTPHPSSGLGNAPVAGAFAIPTLPPIPITFSTNDAPLEAYYATYPNTVELQEFLARLDRQRMARDIYVMLYAFGGGRDDVDYRQTNALPGGGAPRPLYSDTHLEEMAQFAVNVVDSLDSDDVVTVFEYDRDLNTGWSLGDEATITGDDDPTVPVDERGVVYGVEAQQLTFGEAMAALCKRVPDEPAGLPATTNHAATEYDDTAHRDFTFIELINVSPRSIDFSTQNEGWQIAVKPKDSSTGIPLGSERRLTLLTAGLPVVGTGASPGFTIGTAGDAQNLDMALTPLPSYMMVDYNWTMATPSPPPYTRIAPDPAGTGLSLDLITVPTLTYRINEAPASTTSQGDGPQVLNDPLYPTDPAGGDLLHFVPEPTLTLDETLDSFIDDTRTIEIELRRRANPHRSAPVAAGLPTHDAESADNPWIVVDRISIPLQVFALTENTDGGSTPNIGDLLDTMKSKERFQPLYGGIRSDDTEAYTDDAWSGYTAANPHVYNSLGADNRSSPAIYSLWQPHLNREFSTGFELLTVPVHGPRDTTLSLGSRQSEDFTTTGSPLLVGWDAGINRLLRPGKNNGWSAGTAYAAGDEVIGDPYAGEIYRCTTAGTSGIAAPPWGSVVVGDGSVTWQKITGARANRWARLLEFFEVPAREGRHDEVSPYILDLGNIGNNDTDLPAGGIRQPGRVNLNTMRHPAVEAGLLDDSDVMSINPTATTVPYLPAWDGTDGRDWWATFIAARDQPDQLPGPTFGWYLAGVPGSRPFRGLNFSAEGGASIDHTIFRDIETGIPGEGRKLFELGSLADHNGSTLDYVSRQRLLTKLGQTTTTRSNVFIVHVQVDFFAAKELDPSGAVPAPGYTGPTVVRIGAKLPDSPGHRGFFVIDRSRALEMLTPADLPKSSTCYYDPVTGIASNSQYTYSFNRREDINGNGVIDMISPGVSEDVNGNGILDRFPFRSLIIHRQLIK